MERYGGMPHPGLDTRGKILVLSHHNMSCFVDFQSEALPFLRSQWESKKEVGERMCGEEGGETVVHM